MGAGEGRGGEGRVKECRMKIPCSSFAMIDMIVLSSVHFQGKNFKYLIEFKVLIFRQKQIDNYILYTFENS